MNPPPLWHQMDMWIMSPPPPLYSWTSVSIHKYINPDCKKCNVSIIKGYILMFSKIGIVRMIPLILEQLDEKYMTYSECILGH